MSLFKKNESYLGVDIGSGGIKLVELRKNKGRPQLWTYGILEEEIDIHLKQPEKNTSDLISENRGVEPGTKDIKKATSVPVHLDDERIDRYASLLRQLAKKSKVTTNQATVSLPVSYIFHTILTLPIVEEKQRDAIVKAEITKMLDRPVEEMQVVHQVIPPMAGEKDGRYTRLLVTAAPKSLVMFYTAIFQKAGFQLEELETEAFALERSLVGRDPTTAMVVDVGSERTNFFIIDQGLPLTHRSIQIGGNNIDRKIEQIMGVEKSMLGQIKSDIGKIDNTDYDWSDFLPITDQIVKEIEYGFDLYLKQSGNQGKKPEKIILTGGGAFFPPILQQIKHSFDMKVFIGDPWARVVYQQGLRTLLDKIGPRMAVSIGLAMRNII